MNKFIMSLALVALAGCTANPFKPDTMEIKASEGANTVPTWYLETPADTPMTIYAVASGVSEDMQFSLDKAMHEAKVTLGDKIETYVSSDITRTIGDKGPNMAVTTSKVSKSGFEKVDVSKYVVEKKLIFRERGDFRTYVMLKLDVN